MRRYHACRLDEARECDDLSAAQHRQLGKSCKAVGHVLTRAGTAVETATRLRRYIGAAIHP